MEHILRYNGHKVRYKDQGSGTPIVLLHGYLESLNSWNEFAAALASDYRVITPDLPGHGETGVPGTVSSMDYMAEVVKYVLESAGISKAVVIGHSMGGYATLAFAARYPDALSGFGLFHSAPFPDTDEKKKNRDREIQLVREGKKNLIFNTNIPKMFADDNLEIMADKVEAAKEIARHTPEEGIIAVLEGMKARSDRTQLVKEPPAPFLYLLGKKDKYIAFENIEPFISGLDKAQVEILENSGHLGFIEEKERAEEIIRAFMTRIKL